jgi:hypothetical protein
MSAVQYSIWFVAAVWLMLATASAVSARLKVSRLQRKVDKLSEELKGLAVAEQRRLLKEINTPKVDEMKRRQKGDAKKSLAAEANRNSLGTVFARS